MAKVVIVKSAMTKADIQRERLRAPRRSASSDGEARCPSAHTTSITGLASDDHRRTSRNRHVFAIALL